MLKQKNMKKYLLTVFGDFDSEKCEEIARCMEPLIDSEHLKFQFTRGAIIFHFGSEILMEDIHEFMDLLSPDYFTSFILCEWNETVSVMMNDDLKQHLFDLDHDTEGVAIVPKDPTSEFDSYYDDEDEDDIVTLLLKEVKKGLTTPSLDQLLDKITENGVDSLTPYEKGVLENYSQK